MQELEQKLPSLPLKLKNEILEKGILKKIPKGAEILREGQYVQVVPIVLEGLLKVFNSYDNRELLLYYIEPAESCIMSFSAGLWQMPSKVFAVAAEDTEALLLPVELINSWVREYPALNDLFFRQFNKRYEDLLLSINQVLFDRLDKRLMDYLLEHSRVMASKQLKLRHHEIARDLGSSREVISRVLKKLEKEDKIRQHTQFIEIL